MIFAGSGTIVVSKLSALAQRNKEFSPPTNAHEITLDHLTERIIGSALTVSDALGAGFLMVEESVIVELKATKPVAEMRCA